MQRWAGRRRLFGMSGGKWERGNNHTTPPPAPDSDHPAAGADGNLVELFREHHLELVRLALIVVGDLATAEDVVQDVFERMHRRWHRLHNPASGLAYARSSVLNACRSVHRRSAVARKHAPQLAAGSAATGPDSTSALADRSELAQALRALPRRQREVLVLRYYADLDVAEIAATLRIAPSAVRSNCTRGLVALARILGEDEK
jgi:RNA polymerase sigma-70 factor (sigma-E family)